jgi:hypothetical protein
MSSENNTLIYYANPDMQRLKEAFFSSPKKSEPPRQALKPSPRQINKKTIIAAVGTIIGILFLTILFFLKYDLFFVPHIRLNNKTASLLTNNSSESIQYLGADKRLFKNIPPNFYLALASENKTGMKIRFKAPLDLTKKFLFIYLQKTDFPFKISIVVKDNRFFSNSLKPITMVIKKNQTRNYVKLPLELKNAYLQNTNLAKIKEMDLYFYSLDKQKTNRLIIKDLVLVEPLPQ